MADKRIVARRESDGQQRPDVCFRVMTYNVHRCRGLDGVWHPERIAEVIAACHPDIVALPVRVRRWRNRRRIIFQWSRS